MIFLLIYFFFSVAPIWGLTLCIIYILLFFIGSLPRDIHNLKIRYGLLVFLWILTLLSFTNSDKFTHLYLLWVIIRFIILPFFVFIHSDETLKWPDINQSIIVHIFIKICPYFVALNLNLGYAPLFFLAYSGIIIYILGFCFSKTLGFFRDKYGPKWTLIMVITLGLILYFFLSAFKHFGVNLKPIDPLALNFVVSFIRRVKGILWPLFSVVISFYFLFTRPDIECERKEEPYKSKNLEKMGSELFLLSSFILFIFMFSLISFYNWWYYPINYLDTIKYFDNSLHV